MGDKQKTMTQLLAEVGKEAADASEVEIKSAFTEEQMDKISSAVIEKSAEDAEEGNDTPGVGDAEVSPEAQKLASSILAKADTPEKKQNLMKLANQLISETNVSTQTETQTETGSDEELDKVADAKIDELVKIANVEGRMQAQLFVIEKIAEAKESGELAIAEDATEEEKEAAVKGLVKKLFAGKGTAIKGGAAKIQSILKSLAAKGVTKGKGVAAAAGKGARSQSVMLKHLAKKYPGLLAATAGAGAGGYAGISKLLGIKKKGEDETATEVPPEETKEATEDEKILANSLGKIAAWCFADELMKLAQDAGAAAPGVAAPAGAGSEAAAKAAIQSTEAMAAGGEDPGALATELIQAVQANPVEAAAELVETQSPEHAAQVIAQNIVSQSPAPAAA